MTIQVGDFCVMQDDTFTKYGVAKGDEMLIVGDHMMRSSEEDPYAFRKVFIAAFVKDDDVLVDKQPFLIDAKRLEKVDEARQNYLMGNYELAMKDREGETTH